MDDDSGLLTDTRYGGSQKKTKLLGKMTGN